MNLIIDQGNSYFKAAIFNQGKLVHFNRYVYDDIQKFEKWQNEFNIDNCIVSSVVSHNVISNLSFKKLLTLNSTTLIPIKNKYKTPNTLGLDRLANAVGAWHLNPNKNSLVIDAGTCIKYDLVNNKGEYLGGNISPGLNMRYKALNHFTDQLPTLSYSNLKNPFGANTETSIKVGVQTGISHEIKGFIEQYNQQFEQLTIFMTGGDSKYFDKTDKKRIFAKQNLTLIGLNEILKYNVELQ